MRLDNLKLLVTTVLLASIGVTSRTADARSTQLLDLTPVRPLHRYLSGQRSLRLGYTKHNAEERGFTLPGTQKLAELLESGASKVIQSTKIQNWLLKGRSADDIFTKLELNMAGNKIFEDPKFLTWVVYVSKIDKKTPEKTILTKLMTQYSPDSLANMIAAAKKLSNTEGLAILLQAQQRQIWMEAGKSGDDVFKLLKLDQMGTKLFESPTFTTWSSYVEAFNRNNHNDAVSLFSLISPRFGDSTLVNMLEAAQYVPSTSGIAAKLQSEQRNAWMAAGKSPDDIFALLNLDAAGTKLLKRPEFTTWSSYVDDFNAKNPGDEVSVFSKLSKTYDDLTLSELLEAAKRVSSTESIATKVQTQLSRRWLSEGKSPDDVFKLLKFGEVDLAILNVPKLSAFKSFLNEFNRANPGKETTLLATLTSRYTDLGVAQLVQQGRRFTETKKISEELQAAQFARWYYDGKAQDDIFTLLQLKSSIWRNDPDTVILKEYSRFYKAME